MATAPSTVSSRASSSAPHRSSNDHLASAAAAASLAASTSSAPPLVGSQPPSYNFKERFNEAKTALIDGNKEDARKVFNDILAHLEGKRLPIHSFLQVDCIIGLALTYPPCAPEKSSWWSKVKLMLDIIYANKIIWHQYDNYEKLITYVDLLKNYSILLSLFSENKPLIEEIRDKISECKKSIMALCSLVLGDAISFLHKGQNPRTLELFQLVMKNLPEGLEGDRLCWRALCLLGMALATDSGLYVEKARYTSEAREELDNLFAKRESWNALGEVEKAAVYRGLSYCYQQLKSLIPTTETQIHQEIDEKIRICGNFFTPQPLYLTRMLQAHDFLGRRIHSEAVPLYLEALELLEKESELKGLDSLYPASCYIGLAFCQFDGTAAKTKWVAKAKNEVDKLYANRASWNTLPATKKTEVYEAFIACLSRFQHLIPAVEARMQREYYKKIRVCSNEIGQAAPPSSAPTAPHQAPPPAAGRTVTPGPAGKPWNWVPIFAVCAVAVCCVGLTFYKRIIVKK